jgi:FkbM family methyltransferase
MNHKPNSKIIALIFRKTAKVLNNFAVYLENRKLCNKKELRRWFTDKGGQTHRLFYEELTSNSLVFDIGGYEGQWASDIYSMYRCRIFVFEPVPFFADKIEERFAKNTDIFVYKFGLSDKTQISEISLEQDSSSLFKTSNEMQKVKLVCISDFIRDNKIDAINLLKINVEGAEYSLLENLLDNNLIKCIDNIQVQFHNFVKDADKRMAVIQKRLNSTHELTYQYRYVWENWKKR